MITSEENGKEDVDICCVERRSDKEKERAREEEKPIGEMTLNSFYIIATFTRR